MTFIAYDLAAIILRFDRLFRVTIGEFVATGCGQSKKKAKHDAAKAILDKLRGAQESGKAPMGQPPIPDLASKILSPYDDGIQGNPVGTLQVSVLTNETRVLTVF